MDSASRSDCDGPTVIGFEDDAALRALDASDFQGLHVRRQVLVDDPEPAFASHRDRGPGFRDGVHGRADEWYIQADFAGQASTDIDVCRYHFAEARNEHDVIERQAFA